VFDVTGLVPEARKPALAAARVYWEHTRPWAVGLVCFGSAVKGGVIPGASDLDFHLYLTDEAFTPEGRLPLERCLAICRDLAAVDFSPFRYVECSPERDTDLLEEGHVGFAPGTYHRLAGRVPVAEATAEELRAQAHRALTRLDPLPEFVTEGLLRHGEGLGQLATMVRPFAQLVWPVLYQVLALREDDAIAVWQAPKERAVAMLADDSGMGWHIREFDAAVRAYYPSEIAIDQGLSAIRQGVAFLRAAKAWADRRER